ncbi:MAG: D-aminoacyl-tRNA deacylase [Candidatus Woesearchaeota archaeon]|jgi:D-aminoacyl-tRNA deacylase|nr:D-aminoacyl-tRNA deacylase [Candidatus Woesearchaeota archaeon]MDP7323470.1 D-aminoacyl-tRNA deacylase [Candidatus Woesearchaeota archaeon]|tara:strand:+ start:270 stop:1076 length:807 start_codon:yes stop_codon:yes gene_type:complete
MQFAIIVSQKDIAGLTIKDALLEKGFSETQESFDNTPIYEKNNLKLYTLETETILSEHLDKRIKADMLIFATRHKSESGKPTLCCHFPGNWSKAEYGGKDATLCPTNPSILKKVYLKLKELGPEGFDVTMEATHHGPELNTPVMFIEIGSGEEQWKDKEAGSVLAETILNITSSPELPPQKIAICIGGNHYCSQFNKVVEKHDIAISHVCPKYHLEALNEDLLKQAIEKTPGKVDFILLDWNGLSSQKQKVKEILENLKLEYKRTDQI